jgi:hypothetical protein
VSGNDKSNDVIDDSGEQIFTEEITPTIKERVEKINKQNTSISI